MMKLVILGTLAVSVSRTHHGPAQVLLVDDEPLLFDCGQGATQQLARAGIRPTKVNHLFFTHHHFDHDSEFPYFALATWSMGRQQNLQVYGPVGTRRIAELLFKQIYREDMDSRLTLPFANRATAEIVANDIEKEGPVYTSNSLLITAAFSDHIKEYITSIAYRVESQGKIVAIVGDSIPCPGVRKVATGADLLVHECSDMDEDLSGRGFSRWHTGPRALGQIAQEAGVKTLVLTHFSHQMLRKLDILPAIVKENFRGEVIVADELMEIEVQ